MTRAVLKETRKYNAWTNFILNTNICMNLISHCKELEDYLGLSSHWFAMGRKGNGVSGGGQMVGIYRCTSKVHKWCVHWMREGQGRNTCLAKPVGEFRRKTKQGLNWGVTGERNSYGVREEVLILNSKKVSDSLLGYVYVFSSPSQILWAYKEL